MMNKPAILVLADGTIFTGISVGAAGESVGELVFNTSMTGYQEMLTDPSYAQQIITLTTAHVGNTGCNEEDMESTKVWAAGLVMRDCSIIPSNYRATSSLPDWLKRHGVIAIADIDTRALTLKLRDHGAIAACISTNVDNPDAALARAKAFAGLQGADLASEVTRHTKERWDKGLGSWSTIPIHVPRFNIVAYDFGVKSNILRLLQDRGCHITVVPAKTSAEEVLSMNPQGIVLSNGPGDPEACDYAVAATKEFLQLNIPILGICLGFQILALACGGVTRKMKFGHHGSNHPVIEVAGKQQVFITSQNHGFTVDEASLPDCLEITHRSLFDNTIQGIRHKTKIAFGFQGHPEASPGPHDIDVIFNNFVEAITTKTDKNKSPTQLDHAH